MIVSASRRTDIPCFYANWFFRRLQEGFALVRNPMNPRQVRRVDLSRSAVDGFVFWTKDPGPMLDRLSLLDGYPYYFQFTLNAYGQDIEPRPAREREAIIGSFLRLSDRIGPERVVWRYDPVLLSPGYPVDFHAENFGRLAVRLSGYTEKCVFSFLDLYACIRRGVRELGLRPADEPEMRALAGAFAQAASESRMNLATCAEGIDLAEYGIGHGRCVDAGLLSKIAGRPIAARKDRNQRPACGCAASVDIGAYHTCGNGCRYCYANHGQEAVTRNLKGHDPEGEML